MTYRLPSLLLLALASAWTSSACLEVGGHLHGEWLALEACTDDSPVTFEPFTQSWVFMGATKEAQVLMLSFSDSHRSVGETDRLTMILEEVDVRVGEVESTGEVVLPLGPGGVPLGLTLAASCPRSQEALVAGSGSARFQALGYRRGERVRGDLDFELIDQRTGVSVSGAFTADFDFRVEVARPHQLFSDPSDHNPRF